jgi:hypothetical protein
MAMWRQIGRWLDAIFGGNGDHLEEVDPDKVEAAVQLIHCHVEEEQRATHARKLRVSELAPERQAQLAKELAQLLKKPPSG